MRLECYTGSFASAAGFAAGAGSTARACAGFEAATWLEDAGGVASALADIGVSAFDLGAGSNFNHLVAHIAHHTCRYVQTNSFGINVPFDRAVDQNLLRQDCSRKVTGFSNYHGAAPKIALKSAFQKQVDLRHDIACDRHPLGYMGTGRPVRFARNLITGMTFQCKHSKTPSHT